MVVLNLQAINLTSVGHCRFQGHNIPRSGSIRCGIAEASGEPAPMGQKTRYKDGVFEKAFMTLFARKMEKFARGGEGETKKLGWLDYDYESFVEVSKRVMQGRNRLQQQQVVREVLLSMLPPGAPAQGTLIQRIRFLIIFE